MMIFRPAGHPAPPGAAPARARASSLSMAVILEARGVTKRFGGLTAAQRRGLRPRATGTSPRSSAPTAPARRPSSTCSPASTSPEDGTVTFRGTLAARSAPGSDHRARHLPDVPEHPALRQHDGGRERAGRHARRVPLGFWDVLRRGPRWRARGAGALAARPPSCSTVVGLARQGQRGGAQSALRRPAPARDRRGPWPRSPAAAAARRAHRGHDPGRGARA